MAEASDGDRQVYGLLELAGIDVALPLSVLREVVACPPALAPLPATASGLLGALDLRALIVPVLDLRPGLHLPDERTGTQVVVILSSPDGPPGDPGRTGEQVLGLLVDRVHGIVSVPAQDLLSVGATAGGTAPALLFAHTFRHPDTGAVVSVLDPDRLLALPGLPRLRRPGGPAAVRPVADAGTGQGAAMAERSQTLAVLRCGAYLLGIDAEHVHTTRPGAVPTPSVLTGPVCRGVTPYLDREVPVVDLLALLGLSNGASPPRTGAALVLEVAGGYVAADLDALQDLVQVDPDDVVALPAVAVARPDLLRGVVELPGHGPCLVLDGPALRTDPALSALARLNTAATADDAPSPSSPVRAPVGGAAHRPDRADGTPPLGAPEYLVYTSGGIDLVTPLEQISEIVPVPAELIAAGSAAVGMTMHRRQALPVVSLATLLDLPAASPASVLLLIAGDGPTLALAVDGLHSIARLSWTDDAPAPSRTPRQQGPDLQARPLVTVTGDSRLLPEVDLRALVRQVHGAAHP